MITIRKAAAALAMAALPLSATPAQAHAAAGIAVGIGTISPGLPGCNQRVTFSGTAVLTAEHVGAYPVSFSGSSAGCEDIALGQGCGTLSGGVSGTVCYNRIGNVVQLSGTVTVGGHTHQLTATCEFVPLNAQPTTSYALTCQIVLT